MVTSATLSNFQNAGSVKMVNLWNSDHAAADEGSFFVATNPTVGTGIATTTSVVDDAATASATHAQYAPVMLITNNWPTTDTNNTRIYLKYLRMLCTAAPTSATLWNFSFRGDSRASRYISGGSLIAPVNINMDSGTASRAQIYFGAVLTNLPTAANGRLLSCGAVQGSIPVVKDQWMFTFGDQSMPTNVLHATGNKALTIPCGPMILGPGQSISLGMWGTSCAGAPAWEFELGYVERPAGK